VFQSVRRSVPRLNRVRPQQASYPLLAWRTLIPTDQPLWAGWLRTDLTNQVALMLSLNLLAPIWEAFNPIKKKSEEPTKDEGSDKKDGDKKDKPTGVPEATVEELVTMAGETGKWFVHSTPSIKVGQLQVAFIDAKDPAGTNDPNAQNGVYAFRGIIGVNYGDYSVFIPSGNATFNSYVTSKNPDEYICTVNVPLKGARWAHRTRAEEALKLYHARKAK
jgi:hypothetical protein